MKLQVLVHGIYVIKNIMCNPRYDAHELRVMQLPLGAKDTKQSKENCEIQEIQERNRICLLQITLFNLQNPS